MTESLSLEERVEQVLADNQELRDRVQELENKVDETKQQTGGTRLISDQPDDGWFGDDPPIGRRGALTGAAGLLAIIFSTGSTLGQSTIDPDLVGAACEWLGDQQAAQYRLFNLGLLHNYNHSDATSQDTAPGSLAAGQVSGEVRPYWDFGDGNGLVELATASQATDAWTEVDSTTITPGGSYTTTEIPNLDINPNDTGDAIPFTITDDGPDGVSHHADQQQFDIGASMHPDWGYLFVGPRPPSSAGDVDMIATLGDSMQSVTLQNTNDGVWGTRFGNFTVDADAATTVTHLANLYIPDMITAGTNVTATNRYSIYDPNGHAVHQEVTTESLVIGGTLYEEDANSPLDADADPVTYTVSGNYDEIIIIPDRSSRNEHSKLRSNGVETGTQYTHIFNDGTSSAGNNQWSIVGRLRNYRYISVYQSDDGLNKHLLSCDPGGIVSNPTVSGENDGASGQVSSVTFLDTSIVTRIKFRVFGRVMSV